VVYWLFLGYAFTKADGDGNWGVEVEKLGQRSEVEEVVKCGA
jgi:hypothetical protein